MLIYVTFQQQRQDTESRVNIMQVKCILFNKKMQKHKLHIAKCTLGPQQYCIMQWQQI